MHSDAATAGSSKHNLAQDFELLQATVREAGAIALSYFRRDITSTKKADGTRVSEADLAVDVMLRSRLIGERPGYGWLSEETADDPARLKARLAWIVDPIDGTHAFLEGQPEWVVAVALVDRGLPVLSAVFNPATDEMFTAMAGAGAKLNGRPIAVRDRSMIEGSFILASGGLFKKKMAETPWPKVRTQWVNSVAYRIARVAQGYADATISLSDKSEWDLAAPALLVQEAGGKVTGIDGGDYRFNRPVPRLKGMVAAGAELHRLLIERTRTVA
jgi:myo-inositol-1(or 4)-monophosphatase